MVISNLHTLCSVICGCRWCCCWIFAASFVQVVSERKHSRFVMGLVSMIPITLEFWDTFYFKANV